MPKHLVDANKHGHYHVVHSGATLWLTGSFRKGKMEIERMTCLAHGHDGGKRKSQDLNLNNQAPDLGSSPQPGSHARDSTGHVGMWV